MSGGFPVPVASRAPIIETALILFVFAAGFAGAFMFRAHDTVSTRTVHVARSWGKPNTTVDGAQVNAQLAGFKCDVYQQRQTIVCHR